MNEFGILTVIAVIGFIIGYDLSSYRTMRKMDPLYKKMNKWIIGYNTFRVWKSYRDYKNGNSNG